MQNGTTNLDSEHLEPKKKMQKQAFIKLVWDDWDSFTILGVYPSLIDAQDSEPKLTWKQSPSDNFKWLSQSSSHTIVQTDSYI